MQRIKKAWFKRWLEVAHECKHCGDIDDVRVHARCVTVRSSAGIAPSGVSQTFRIEVFQVPMT
jgi:hypothetical protein